MSNSESVRIGILSFAHGHAHSYTAALRELPDVELAGIYDADAARGHAASARYAAPYFADPESLLAHRLDGVIVCAENANHAPLVHLAAGQVPNILCEKPIATTRDDAEAMLARCRVTGTRLQIAFPVRFNPTIRRLKSMLDQGELGQVYAVKCTNHGGMPGGWFADPALAGGGAILDHTVHVADLLRWFWHTEFAEVYAEVGQSLLHPGLGMDDVGLLSFALANGVYGTLDTSWSRPSSYPTWGDVKIEVVAEQGTVTVDAFRQHLAVSSDPWGKTKWVEWGSDMNAGLITDFVEMIRTGRAPSIPGEDGLAAFEVALAAYASAAQGRPVQLHPVT